MDYKIDANNKILGRLASEIAIKLRGKDSPDFNPAKLSQNTVTVVNTDKLQVTGKKLSQKLYRRHSGYHGGLREETLERVMDKDSRLVLKYAVMGMLPKNRSRNKLIKNLVLVKGEK